MKPLPLILVVLLAGGAGAAAGLLAARCSQSNAPAANEALQADIKPQAGLPAKSTTREAELAAKVENLERALDALHQDVSELRAGSSRKDAVAVEPEKAPIDQDSIAFAAQHKSAIKAVIEEDRLEQARKAEEDRKQQAIQQSLQRADRTAQRVGLNPAQTKQLEGFYEQQRVRMDELRGNMQNGGATGDPQAMRQTFQEFRTWSENELTTLFGSDLSAKIIDEGGFGMGRGGFGGGAGGFGGGPGGGGNAGGAQGANPTGGAGGRRGRAAGTTGAPGGAGAPGGNEQTTTGPGGG